MPCILLKELSVHVVCMHYILFWMLENEITFGQFWFCMIKYTRIEGNPNSIQFNQPDITHSTQLFSYLGSMEMVCH